MPAKNAADTIARAIASALPNRRRQKSSSSMTARPMIPLRWHALRMTGTGRLNVVRFEENRGPAAARNHAIAISHSPLIGVLDADDFFFPGRLGQLLSQDGWDFVRQTSPSSMPRKAANAHGRIDRFDPTPRLIDLSLRRRKHLAARLARGEIGFPEAADAAAPSSISTACRYNETLRLGEDYDLYARAPRQWRTLQDHPQLRAMPPVVRGNSLSGSHRTIDLKRLYEAEPCNSSQGAD